MVRESTGLPAVVENDVRALTAAEHWFGAAAGCSESRSSPSGSGSAGIVVDDRPVDGASGGSGQIGHLPVTEWGRSASADTAGVSGRTCPPPQSSARCRPRVAATLRTTRYDEELRLAAAGNPVARRVVEEAGRALGTLIGTIAAITAPITVLLSGEGVALASAVLDTAGEYARSVHHWTLPDVPIEIAPFTFTEWAKGAAVIALRNQLDSALRAGCLSNPLS